MKKLIILFVMVFCIVSVADAQHHDRHHHRDRHHYPNLYSSGWVPAVPIKMDTTTNFYLSANTVGLDFTGSVSNPAFIPFGLGVGYRLNTSLHISLIGGITNFSMPEYEYEYSDEEYYEIQGKTIEITLEKYFRFGHMFLELSGGIGYNSYPDSNLSGVYFPLHIKIGQPFSPHFEVFIDFTVAYSNAFAYDYMYRINFFCFRYRF